MRHKLYVLGVGPGAPDYLTPAARAVICAVGTVVGAPRLRPLAGGCRRFIAMGAFDAAFAELERALDAGDAAVLVSGDTGIFSLLPLLKKHFSPENIEVIPGISSMQTLCARCAQTWVDAVVLSGHGRALSEAKLLDTVDCNAKTVFFCGPAIQLFMWPVKLCIYYTFPRFAVPTHPPAKVDHISGATWLAALQIPVAFRCPPLFNSTRLNRYPL